jgi:hypothetical protein
MAFSLECNHDRKTLERYLLEYPQHASALIDCSIALLLSPTLQEVAVVEPSKLDAYIERAWHRFEQAKNSIPKI